VILATLYVYCSRLLSLYLCSGYSVSVCVMATSDRALIIWIRLHRATCSQVQQIAKSIIIIINHAGSTSAHCNKIIDG
jgi:hypothetical protein